MTTKDQIAQLNALSQGAAASLLGLSVRHFRDLDAPRNQDGSYSARRVVAWFVTRETSEEEELTSGPDSPGLERYRLAKARVAELDAAEREGALVSRAVAREILGRWAARIRKAGVMLQRNHGNAAQQLLDSALGDCARILAGLTGENDGE
jgi:phage terminase Nu1 subunit (DNA packaging protein)